MACAELWLCLHFFGLPLTVFEESDPGRPAVVVQHRTVLYANRDNLEPGLAVSTASALYPDLQVLERAPEREAQALQALAYLAYSFTPAVSIAADNSLLLEIGGCRRLYRGINPLLEQLRAVLQERGHEAWFGLAATPKAAWLLARHPHAPALQDDVLDTPLLQRQLAALPVDCLQIPPADVLALRQMGIHSLGALRALPSAAIGKRFGAGLVLYLQQLAGTSADPQDYFVPAPVFRQGLTFLDGIPQRQMLLFPMKRLLQALGDYLRARQLHCHLLRWQLFDAHQLQAEFVIELSRTQNDVQVFLELSRIKLDQVALRESVFSLALCSEDFFESAPASTQLFPDARDHAVAGHALFDRLQARLGAAALQRLQTAAALWPEHSWCEADTAVSCTAPVVLPVQGGPRPTWLLPQPQPLRERDGVPLWKRPLTLLRGPERLDNHWWRGDEKDHCRVRDYFVARTCDDRLCWIFREAESRQWFLHGWFA